MKQLSTWADTEDILSVGIFPLSKLTLNRTKDVDEIQNNLWQVRCNNIQLDAINWKRRELDDAFNCRN